MQNPSEALLSFGAHVLGEPVQSWGLGLRDRKGRREEAVSMTNVHLTHSARTQHRICLLLLSPQALDHSCASLPALTNPDCPQQRFLRAGHTLRQCPQIIEVQVLKHCRKKGLVSAPPAVRMPPLGDSSEALPALQSPASKTVSLEGQGKGSSHSLGTAPYPHLEFGGTNKSLTQHGASHACPAGLVPM